jgi:hypothetical protein
MAVFACPSVAFPAACTILAALVSPKASTKPENNTLIFDPVNLYNYRQINPPLSAVADMSVELP